MEWLNSVNEILNSPLATSLLGNKAIPQAQTPVIQVQNPVVEKKTPWGLIAGGVGAVVIILVLLMKKK